MEESPRQPMGIEKKLTKIPYGTIPRGEHEKCVWKEREKNIIFGINGTNRQIEL